MNSRRVDIVSSKCLFLKLEDSLLRAGEARRYAMSAETEKVIRPDYRVVTYMQLQRFNDASWDDVKQLA
jgi:hypothetical protein